jgi:hypothetical protein
MDPLEVPVDEIERPFGIDHGAGDRPEAVGEPLDRRQAWLGLRDRPIWWPEVEPGEFAFAHHLPPGEVLDRIVERILARAQEGTAALVVAAGVPALGVDVEVAEADLARVEQPDRAARRVVAAGHAVAW